MKKILFIDRDGTILREPDDEQIDSFEKFRFVPGAISALSFLRRHTDYLFVLVSNQDGLGTSAYPEADFWPTHNLMLETLHSEGVEFDAQHIDRTRPEDNRPTRKPGTAMLTPYQEGYDLENSYVIGDRKTDAQLARNLGCRALILSSEMDWQRVREIVYAGEREASVVRKTRETGIEVRLNLDGSGMADIQTGLGFFDHMLEQLPHHGGIDLHVRCHGDLHVDEHHTIEDVALALGECFLKALTDKRGIERYGFCLPMDDSLCQVAIDLGGRPWLVWNVNFKRERIGDVPTEMFFHFFKSLSDAAHMNLNIKAEGQNEHHKIEGIFKAFARTLKMAVRRDVEHMQLPSSKGTL
ncbi:MAG: bifunctional histidinol-phosphatase/imidazoleglycerol-phosphate dehydratase HisB [Bacteroidaceae bacterium]|nr:bifunctional histidinol-phosphatase/imidazoleglycerol-phosphate dehydratase HisB [Bacteroidaceae bacterium]